MGVVFWQHLHNKEHKYSIGEKVKEKVFDVLVGIYKANKSSSKSIVLG